MYYLFLFLGIKVTCPGNPGHGSRFIEGTAAEKLRAVINRFLDFRQQEKNRMEANPHLTLGDVTTVNLTQIEVMKNHLYYYVNHNVECTLRIGWSSNQCSSFGINGLF